MVVSPNGRGRTQGVAGYQLPWFPKRRARTRASSETGNWWRGFLRVLAW